MNFTKINTYSDSYERAFEALCNQLFERWVKRNYSNELAYFSTVRGDGGDGGVEAYAILTNEEVIGVQTKWFPINIGNSQITQIRKSVVTAIKIRPNLKQYIICLPKDLSSLTARNKNKDNTEEARINKLKEKAKKDFPDLELFFWGEHQLRIELQKPENEGIHRYWFEKAELSQESLKRKFEIEKAGWLNERYVPRLHSSGKAEWQIEQALFTPKARLDYIESLKKNSHKINVAITLIEEFNNKVSGHPINTELKEVSKNLKNYESAHFKIIDAIQTGATKILPISIKEMSLWDVKLKFERNNYGNLAKNIQEHLSVVLENLHKANLPYWMNDFPIHIAPYNLILMGEPGTGKTHTLANVVETRLNSNLPAFIIQAKTSPFNSWAEIFQYGIGGLYNWSFEDICSALESLATRTDAYRVLRKKENDLPIEPTSVLIAIDGLDEVSIKNYPIWKTRINELRTIAKQFPRLRFVISCRHYGIQDYNPLELEFDDVINQRTDLSSDYPRNFVSPYTNNKAKELAVAYFNEYRIQYSNLHWLEGAFNTPLELRLFCENYKGQNISKIVHPIHTTLKYLLGEKINRLNKEFTEHFTPPWAQSEQVFKKILFIIAEVFKQQSRISHDILCQKIQQQSNNIIDRAWTGKILEFIAKNGILFRRRIIDENDIMEIEEIIYETTYQSYLDYLIALKTASNIGNNEIKNLSSYLPRQNSNILNLTAIVLLNDYGILIGEEGYWVTDFDESILHFMQYRALAAGSTTQIKCRLPLLAERFKTSQADRASILEFLVIPLYRNRELALEKQLIHKILSSYDNSFERDLIWSGYEYFENHSQEVSSPSGILQRIYGLESWQNHDERPLLLAWGLSCVDNHARKLFRKELTKWGARNVLEFVKLLDLIFYSSKDPQIQEDLLTIAMGIVSLIHNPNTGLLELANWVLQNIFEQREGSTIYNAIIRYSSRAVVERAYQLNEIKKEEVKKSRPPYYNSQKLIPIDLSIFKGKSTYPFENDLNWYVIENSYEGFLKLGFKNRLEPNTANFLKPYQDKYKIDFGPKEWAKAAANAYIRGLGFNRTDGTTMTQETHGMISPTMTFEEKYIWLSVHELQGYLASLLPYQNSDTSSSELLKDYSKIVHVSNPVSREILMSATELEEFKLAAQIGANGTWFIPEEIAYALQRTKKELKEDLLDWANTPQQPDFKKWIETGVFFKNTETQNTQNGITLYGYLSLAEPNQLGRTSMHQTCFLMNADLHPSFVNDFQNHIKEISFYFEDLSSFEAITKSIYSSPKDIVWMDWIEEADSRLKISLSDTRLNAVDFVNTVVRVIDTDIIDGENYHRLPSKFLRQELEIVNMGYHSFFDIHSNQVAWSLKSGKPYYNSQNFVFVDAEKFQTILDKHQLKPVWVFFQFKGTTAELKQENKNAHAQNCKLWIVWEEAGEFKHHLYHDGWFKKDYS